MAMQIEYGSKEGRLNIYRKIIMALLSLEAVKDQSSSAGKLRGALWEIRHKGQI